MSKDKLTSLTELHTQEVSLVDRGANKKKRFPIFKQENPMTDFNEILKAVLETELDEESDLDSWVQKAQLSEKGVGAVKAALRILAAYKDELPGDTMDTLSQLAGFEKSKPVETKKAKQAKACGPTNDEEEEEIMDEDKSKEVKKEFAGLPEAVRAEVETVLKSRDDELAALRARNEEITKALHTEKDIRELGEWVAKAEKDLSHYPGKSSRELGEMLKKLSDVDPTLAASQFDTMKSASDAMRDSVVLKEAGGSFRDVTGSAWNKIEQLAEGIFEKSEDPKMTQQRAMAKALETPKGRKLYNEYLSENPKQSGDR